MAMLVLALAIAGCSRGFGATADAVSAPARSVDESTTASTRIATRASGDPSLAGVQGVTRVVDELDVLEARWGLLSPTGEYIGPIDLTGDPLLFQPIGGYGDFSWMAPQDRFDMDPALRQELVLGCVADTDPRFAQLIEDTGQFLWGDLAGQLSEAGMATYIACDAGLHVPRLSQQDWTPAMWQKAYDYAMATKACVDAETGIVTQQDRFNMDSRIVEDLVLQCVSDTDPRFADLIARTGALNPYDLPGQLGQVAFAVFYACKKGLQLPPFIESDRTPAMLAEMYAYFVAWWTCMEEDTGMDFGPVGSLEEYTATNGDVVPRNSPYWFLDDATLQHLHQVRDPRLVGSGRGILATRSSLSRSAAGTGREGVS